jgi:molecular chaperone DnaK (HSP70)
VDQIKEEEKFITYKIVPLENKSIGFEVTLRGQTHILTPQQVLAYYMKSMKKLFEKANINSKEVVVTVPSYFSNVERQAVLDACEIAHLKCLRLINESTAVCMNYGFFKKPDLH